MSCLSVLEGFQPRGAALTSANAEAHEGAFPAIGRVWVGPLAGVLVETIGWPTFFIISTVVIAISV